MFVCLFVLMTPGMPVVALLLLRRLSQGTTQSIPGLRLKKLGAALPLALWLITLALADLLAVCWEKYSLSPHLSAGSPGHFRDHVCGAVAARARPRPLFGVGHVRRCNSVASLVASLLCEANIA